VRAWTGGRGAVRSRIAEVFDLFLHLAKRSEHVSGELSGGEEEMCATAVS
jgi:ABC-type branched-subunit amino acid transport system ATPase component